MQKTVDFLSQKADLIGLLLTIIGTLFLTYSVGDLPRGGTTSGYSFAYVLHPTLIKYGLLLIIFGFVAQLFDSLVNRHIFDRTKAFSLCVIAIILITIFFTVFL